MCAYASFYCAGILVCSVPAARDRLQWCTPPRPRKNAITRTYKTRQHTHTHKATPTHKGHTPPCTRVQLASAHLMPIRNGDGDVNDDDNVRALLKTTRASCPVKVQTITNKPQITTHTHTQPRGPQQTKMRVKLFAIFRAL